jgi:diguanylate cyclase (GGDEF)-like protein
VASALGEQVFRPSDLAARYGGEEFAVIMPNTDLDGALHVAERIREAVHALDMPHGASLTAQCVTLSIGAAAFMPTEECRADDLVAAADAALYRAKHQGRNRVVSTDRIEELAEA